MKKRGFTLIELLAVIVVLAIIALIATPIVMNTIKKSQKGAAERSADSYIRQVETAVAEARLDNKTVPDGTYQIDGQGNLIGTGLPDGKLKIEMNGNKPTSGTIKINNGQVTTDSTMTIKSYEVAYDPTTKKYEASEKGNTTPTTPSTTVVYRWSTDTIKTGDTINPSDTSKFTKDASTLGKSYYLKHVLDKDNKVTESYACAILKGKEYCLRGGDSSFYGYAENKANYTGNALIMKQIEDAKIEGINCYCNASYCDCSGSSGGLSASYGTVSVRGGGGYCDVNDGGSSSCVSQLVVPPTS